MILRLPDILIRVPLNVDGTDITLGTPTVVAPAPLEPDDDSPDFDHLPDLGVGGTSRITADVAAHLLGLIRGQADAEIAAAEAPYTLGGYPSLQEKARTRLGAARNNVAAYITALTA